MAIMDYGWNSAWAERFATHLESGLQPARVIDSARGIYVLETNHGRARGELAGRLEYGAESPIDLPVTGDWVAVTPTDPALIIAVVERATLFTRVIDDGQRQPLAANVDVAFLINGLDHDWNPNRLDRYLALTQEAHVQPVIVLNKRDLHPNPAAVFQTVQPFAPAVLISALEDDLESVLGAHVQPGQTAALFGSSGAGKSTIANKLLGAQLIATGTETGQHTTTTRTLHRLPTGWLLLDMPGLRAVGVGGGVEDAFAQITTLAANCRFADCKHENEPGCAVLGAIPADRLASYRKLQAEAAYQQRKENPSAARAEKAKWKQIHAALKKKPDKRQQ